MMIHRVVDGSARNNVRVFALTAAATAGRMSMPHGLLEAIQTRRSSFLGFIHPRGRHARGRLNELLLRRFAPIVGLLWILLAADGSAAATFTRIVESLVTPVPGQPSVTFLLVSASPGVDGQKVIFASAQPVRSLWSANLDGSGLVNLADETTPIPGGSGHFVDVVPFAAANGTVVFRGTDGASQAGYYAVSSAGGPVTLLLNRSTPLPGGTGTFDVNDTRFNVDGDTLVFANSADVFTVPSSGGATVRSLTNGAVVCDPNLPLKHIGTWRLPDLGGATIAGARTVAIQVGDLDTDKTTAIRVAPLSEVTTELTNCPGLGFIPNVATNTIRVADLNSPVPGDLEARKFDGASFGAPVIDGGTVVFFGATRNAGVAGLYSWSGGVALTKLVDTNTAVPGGTGTFQPPSVNSSLSAYTLNNGTVVFRGTDAAGRNGLYAVSTAGGPVTKILAPGDVLDGSRTVADVPSEAIRADSLSGGKLALIVDVNDPNATAGVAKSVYVADLTSVRVSVNQSVFHSGDGLRIGLIAKNAVAAFDADLYLGLLLPDGATLCFVTALSPLAGQCLPLSADPAGFPRLAADIPVPSSLDATLPDLMAYAFGGAEPPGVYSVFVLLTRPGTLGDGAIDPGDIIGLDVQSFTFQP
jgi:hypothetical protein